MDERRSIKLPLTLTASSQSPSVRAFLQTARDQNRIAEQIAKLSEAFELKAGDIIYSGTPENVGPVVRGDVLRCKLEGLPDMSIRIV
jgi:2-keto-4-pentenoate hydratase/2-oxohepta-3-ene-1,7-dioic acid hydratase in catechol pathway